MIHGAEGDEEGKRKGAIAMIRFTQGDILKAEAEALVNTVNCVGVIGLALPCNSSDAFRPISRHMPAACAQGEVQPGRMFIFETGTMMLPHYVINFPTKRHWHGKSRIEDIQAGLQALVKQNSFQRWHCDPSLGSGLGGLDWQEVKPLMEQTLADLTYIVEILVFEPLDMGTEITPIDPVMYPR